MSYRAAIPLRRSVAFTGVAVLIPMQSTVHAQELKRVRIGYPAFSLTFLTFFAAQFRDDTKRLS